MLVDTTAGLEQLTALTELDLTDNYINQIDLVKLKNLTTLKLDGNLLQNLDLSNYSALKNLSITMNPLHTLKLPRTGQLESLSLGFNSAGEGLGYSTLSYYLNTNSAILKDTRFFDDKTGNALSKASFQRISNIDFAQQFHLKSFSAGNLGLGETSLAFEGFPAANNLESLDLSSNNLTGINTSKLSNLKSLNLIGNTIVSLDITSNPKLEELNISHNRMSSIKALPNNKLKTLNILGTSVPDLDLKTVFDSKTLSTVTMSNSAILPVGLAPNLTSLTLHSNGEFDTNRLAPARNLAELTLDSGSINNIYLNNSPFKQVNLTLHQQKSPILVSCIEEIASLNIGWANPTPSEDTIALESTKGCEFKKISLGTYASVAKIDLTSIPSEAFEISTSTSYKNIKLPHYAKSVALSGVSDLNIFSFYDFPQLESLHLNNTSFDYLSLKGASVLKELAMNSVNLNQFDSGAAPDSLTSLALEQVEVQSIDITSIARNLTSLVLAGCSIDIFRSSTFSKGIALDVRATPLKGDSLTTFKQVSGRDLDSNGWLKPLP